MTRKYEEIRSTLPLMISQFMQVKKQRENAFKNGSPGLFVIESEFFKANQTTLPEPSQILSFFKGATVRSKDETGVIYGWQFSIGDSFSPIEVQFLFSNEQVASFRIETSKDNLGFAKELIRALYFLFSEEIHKEEF